MRKLRFYRPWLADVLESRAVPSVAGVSTPTGLLGLSVTLPKQVPVASPQVQAAFAAFDQSYINAVDNVLFAPGPGGLVVPSANRAAFDAVIEQSLETLANELVQSLNSTSTGSTGSAGSPAANQVVAAIVGPGSNSLENQLLAVPIATIELNLPPIANLTNVSAQPLVANVVTTAEQVRPTLRVPITEGIVSSATDPTATSPSSSLSPSSKASQDVRSAFNNFLNDYFQAVQGVLLAPGNGGQVNPQAHRADFDARVNQALQTLETRLTTTLGRYPATSGLGPQIRAAIEGNAANSLKNQLAKLATPDGSQAAIVRDFTLGSTKAIAQALSMVSGDVAKLLGQAGN